MNFFLSVYIAHTERKQIGRFKLICLKTFFFVINVNFKKYLFVFVLIGSVQEYKLKYQDCFITFLLQLHLDSVLTTLKACSQGIKIFHR